MSRYCCLRVCCCPAQRWEIHRPSLKSQPITVCVQKDRHCELLQEVEHLKDLVHALQAEKAALEARIEACSQC